MDYYAALDLFGFDTASFETGCGLYVDDLGSAGEVAEELKELLGEGINVYDYTDSYFEDECKIIRLMRRMVPVIMAAVFVLGSALLLLVLSMFASQFREETGRFLVLGCSRRWCVCRFGLVTLCYVAAGQALGMLVYAASGNELSNAIWDVSSDVIYNSVGRAAGIYETPNYRQGFTVSVEMGTVFAPAYIAVLAGALVAVWAVALAFPLYSVLRTKPRDLLKGGYG